MYKLSVKMGQDSFALHRHNPNSDLFGIIQIHSGTVCFKPPTWTQIRLVGKEKIGDNVKVIVDDTYQLSSRPNDWQYKEDAFCQLDFSLSVPSTIPSSFHDENSDMSRGIYYTIQVKTSLCEQILAQPVHFHQSTNALLPKRVFWGIAKMANHHHKWQYELEFPNTFDLVSCKTGTVYVRLRSMFRQHSNDCCLIGCQIVQLVHMQGYESASQVLTTVTTLLRSPSKTWIQPSQLEFDLNQPILPTVDSLRLSVEHYIKFTFAFCNAAGESDLNLSLEFPMNFIGYTKLVGDSSMIQVQQRSNSIASSLSLSSLNSEEVASQDSAIDTLISPCSKPDCYPQLITLYK